MLTLIWISILALGVLHRPTFAQEGNQVHLAPINLEGFPRISSYLSVRSSTGEFIRGLEQRDVHIIEDGRQVPVQNLQLVHPGIQFVLAISPGPAFDIRDVQGISRYEYLSLALQDWADAWKGSTGDDLSIIAAGGPDITHQADIDRWEASLRSFNPTGEETGPDFEVLTRALDVAADQPPTSGMSSAVLFVSPLPAQDVSLGLQSLAARAAQQGVKIFVWLVASSELFTSPEAEQMRSFAEQTGGEFFAYSGQEPIPSPETFLSELRNAYFLEYDSRITASGAHQASAQVNVEGQRISSSVQEFELDILPPNVAFISPPMEIERTLVDPESDVGALSPESQELELLIEYPDGYERPIIETRLFVDGVEAGVNQEQPFDNFTWDISQYDSAAEHILVVEAEDSLGLIGQSVETSILVSVSGVETSWLEIVSQNMLILVAVLVALLAAALLLLLVLRGRLQPGFLRNWRRRKKLSQPITQPLQTSSEAPVQTRSTWVDRIHWPRSPSTTKPYAQFIPLTDSNTGDSQPPLAITNNRVLFGRDEGKVDQVLQDASVAKVHATLERVSEDTFRLSDENTIAGTWVNYAPVAPGGQTLENGDLVHFGRLGFRFILRDPKRVRKPVLRFDNTE